MMIIRDSRTKSRFFIDNVILDVYGKALGPAGIAVYCALCRHADLHKQTCFPSQQTIADEVGLSRKTVNRALATLKEAGLITWEARTRPDKGGQTSHLYYLLDPPQLDGEYQILSPCVGDTHRPEYDVPTNNPNNEQSSDKVITTPSGSAAELVRMVFDLRDEYETHHDAVFPEDAMRTYPEVTAGCLCGARVSQEMVECPDCRNEVVWLNSRIWRDAFGDPNEASRDTSWQEAPDDFTLRLFARLKIGHFRAKPQAKKWKRVRKTATDAEILDAAKYVIGLREGGHGGLGHIMNLALQKAAERPEKLTAEEAKPALEEHEFPGATTYE